MRNIKKLICKRLTVKCLTLNQYHNNPEHDRIAKENWYQRYIGSMENLNELSKNLKLGCNCKEIKGSGKEHIGHRMVKI